MQTVWHFVKSPFFAMILGQNLGLIAGAYLYIAIDKRRMKRQQAKG